MSVVEVRSRRISKCLAEQSKNRHLNVHDMTGNSSGWIEIETVRPQIWRIDRDELFASMRFHKHVRLAYLLELEIWKGS